MLAPAPPRGVLPLVRVSLSLTSKRKVPSPAMESTVTVTEVPLAADTEETVPLAVPVAVSEKSLVSMPERLSEKVTV